MRPRRATGRGNIRPLVYLVGARTRDRAAVCLAAPSEFMRVEPVASVSQLTPHAVEEADAFLAWDEGKAIPELRSHLSILAHRAPIIAIAERPAVRQVVQALVSGAVDYLEWPCGGDQLLEAATSAIQTAARMLPLRQRADEARQRLSRLSRRERQVLTAMAQGMSTRTIAGILETDPRAVENDRRSLLAKLDLQHSAEAIRLELEASLSPGWTRQSDWMAPWMLDTALPGTG